MTGWRAAEPQGQAALRPRSMQTAHWHNSIAAGMKLSPRAARQLGDFIRRIRHRAADGPCKATSFRAVHDPRRITLRAFTRKRFKGSTIWPNIYLIVAPNNPDSSGFKRLLVRAPLRAG